MKRINILHIALSLVLILILSIGTSCGLPIHESNSVSAGIPVNNNNDGLVYTEQPVQVSQSQAPVLPTIADVVTAVKPSVVAINTEVTVNLFRRSYTQQGAGSGWIIDGNGIIVTNSHVVSGASSITVTLEDGRAFSVAPNKVALDPVNDLAVLYIDAENLPAANIGDASELRVGDWVVTIGNPLGLGISAKEGIVSRLDVPLAVEGQTLDDFIETSAAINPGNSGGPLVNMKGEVVGITSAKISSVGVEGLGYAININKALPVIEKLVANSSG